MTEMTFEHNITYSTDEIYSWNPSNADYDGSAVSINIPWGLSWSFTPRGPYHVADMSSQTYDYAKWDIYQTGIFGQRTGQAMPNPTRFRPGTAWDSTGTLAAIDLKTTVTFVMVAMELPILPIQDQLLSKSGTIIDIMHNQASLWLAWLMEEGRK